MWGRLIFSFGFDSSFVTSVVRSFLLLCCLIVFMMKSLGYTFCCRAARICCFSSSLSFSLETMLSALSNKAVMTLCFADIECCEVYFRYWMYMCWFSVNFY